MRSLPVEVCKVMSLLSDLPDARQAEIFQTLLEQSGLKLERIISWGQATPEGEWYDQDHDEWVLLVTGAASLQMAGESVPRQLNPGDWLYLPAHCQHRVSWTTPDRETVWLAVHWNTNEEA